MHYQLVVCLCPQYSPLQSSVIPLLEGPVDADPTIDEEDPPEIDTSVQVRFQ